MGSGSGIKDWITFNLTSRGQAAVEFKELFHRLDRKNQQNYNGIEEFVDKIIFCASFHHSNADNGKTESLVCGNI